MNALTERTAGCAVITQTAAQVDAGGTMWRLRSLIAMGHDAGRIAHALTLSPQRVEKVLRGEAGAVTPSFGISYASCGTHGGTSARPSRAAASAEQPARHGDGRSDAAGARRWAWTRTSLMSRVTGPTPDTARRRAPAPRGSSPRKPARQPAGGWHEADPPAGHTAITGWRAAATSAAAARAQPG